MSKKWFLLSGVPKKEDSARGGAAAKIYTLFH
jgi:hypothetical protein